MAEGYLVEKNLSMAILTILSRHCEENSSDGIAEAMMPNFFINTYKALYFKACKGVS
jgi:hypothetical protein